MQAKLFMIPWLIELVISQRAPSPPNPTPSAQVLTNDLLVDAHRRHFLDMLRRQQQINDALLLNNALLHPHPLPPLHIPANPAIQELNLPPAPPLFNPFIPAQVANQGPTSKLGTYGKDDEPEKKSEELKETPEEKEGTVGAPVRTDLVKKTLAGVKTVSIQKKGDVTGETLTTMEVVAPTTSTISPEDLEVVQLFKKLNLSKEETKSIVERVEQVVREKLMSKMDTSSTTTEVTTVVTTPSTTTTTTSTTQAPTTTTKEFIEEEIEEEDYSVATTAPPPQMHIRSEENLILQRNNLKHHPIKLQEKKLPESLESEEISQGSIKTSLTHLPIFVANEEEDVASLNPKSALHKRILIASQDREKESDRDLLVDFATGAPLDLSEPDVTKSKYEASPVATSPATLAPAQVTTRPVAPPRLNYHERTDFERLASDYRRRLENTGDINKILQKISENAYISLVERGGRRRLFGS
ncbi:Mucin-5AC [Caenorhabditis elegans]|uniref:Mucin-5AC n=1 Tax=Caenorhabditis elegans TaxID=6239 RepID=Q22539_CAEEL|nr:Mucin-5AC [Caenorhabditis elegans]CCD65379.1 Mucin-5AC [Caenorhabditis elegans]|eukprot:NP_497251.2 Uncharacterized protein CELE_T17H7.7 [Caenorhabditis elegans]